MRFTLRLGDGTDAVADRAMLAALGLPAGGVAAVGETHVRVLPGSVTSPVELRASALTLRNAGLTDGASADVRKVALPRATQLILDRLVENGLPPELTGQPVTTGDTIVVAGEEYRVRATVPGPAAVVAPATVISDTLPMPDDPALGATPPTPSTTTAASPGAIAASPQVSGPSLSEALLGGLDEELETLTGWFRLLAGAGNLPATWGLPEVAGVIVEAPPGCGGPEIVAEAAKRAGASLYQIRLDLVFKPTRLLDLLERALREAPRPGVIHIDRLEAVAGEEGLTTFRTQVGAVMRWFLDSVARQPGLAVAMGVTSVARIDPSISGSALLPRTLRIPPPDTARRAEIFRAATARIPGDDLDFERLGARSAGFSGADILSAIVHASSRVTGGGTLDTETLLHALADTPPTIGSSGLGEVPSFGFEAVAGLDDVKQRLTEAVIWPIKQPERFQRLGIDPPGGILLWGPPGTGKTFVVKALAHEAGAAFFPVKGAELLDKWVGESERAVRELFSRARAAAPSLLFFDELDALAPVRGSSSTSVTDSVVASLLTELDGIGGRGEVVAIGATNRRDLIDPALLRSGRFEVHLHLDLPDRAARLALLGISDVPLAEDVDLETLADETEGLSFADITGLLREAALTALRTDDHALEVSTRHLAAALETQRSR